jgi:hypothetical protein
MLLPLLVARRRSLTLHLLPSKNNKKSARRGRRRLRVLKPKRKPG